MLSLGVHVILPHSVYGNGRPRLVLFQGKTHLVSFKKPEFTLEQKAPIEPYLEREEHFQLLFERAGCSAAVQLWGYVTPVDGLVVTEYV
mmetsp:Transcript_4156/g.8005  ORF Transcript_4156/g.8005 Transcript_4156/m.8005 type:complete len:89 (+) Transcript_4156:52-318(+)